VPTTIVALVDRGAAVRDPATGLATTHDAASEEPAGVRVGVFGRAPLMDPDARQ
jgi:hypothetical protein